MLPIYYIPGSRFRDGTLGGHKWDVKNNRDVQHIIVLTDDADGDILAHELGHALFARRVGGQSWTNSDPDPMKDPNNEIHNTDSQNLMFPHVLTNPQISPTQEAQARASQLVTAPSLVYGFLDNSPYKLDVVFKTMHVVWTTDEAGSNNALESSWSFTVRARGHAATQPYYNDDLAGSTDCSLNLAILDISFPRDPEGPPINDTLTIDVTGTDRDKNSGHDSLPAISKVWQRHQNLWGSGLSSNGLPPGNHREHPPANAEMEYWLDYSINLRQRPRDVIFRDIRCPQSEDASR